MTGDVRRRRRGADLEDAILVAAWEELEAEGWGRFSVQRVAARAGTGKPSVYSRWPTKATLAVACAVRHAVVDVPSRALKGSLRADLVDFLVEFSVFLGGPFGDALRALGSDPLAASHALISPDGSDPAIRPVLEIVEAARLAGDLGGGEIPLRALNLGLIMMNEHFLRRGEPPVLEEVQSMVADAWAPLMVWFAPPT